MHWIDNVLPVYIRTVYNTPNGGTGRVIVPFNPLFSVSENLSRIDSNRYFGRQLNESFLLDINGNSPCRVTELDPSKTYYLINRN